MTLPRAVSTLAAERPDRLAIEGPSGSLSFSELARLSLAYREHLESCGFEPGQRSLMLMRPSAQWLAVNVALASMECAAVYVDPGGGLRAMMNAVVTADPQHVLGDDRARILRLLFPRKMGRRPFVRASRLPPLPAATNAESLPMLCEPDDSAIAMIAFTSGSTGEPKGVVYRHRNARAQYAAIGASLPPTQSSLDVVTFALFAPMNLAMGRSSVLPSMDFSRPGEVDGQHLLDLFADRKVGRCFGSPALWRRVVAAADQRGSECTGPEQIIVGGAPMSATIASDLERIFPKTRLVNAYGATEALPIASTDLNDCPKEHHYGTCVGQPAEGLQLSIEPSPQLQDPFPQGVGELCLCAPWVTEEYLTNPKANTSAFFERDGMRWYRTGDAGLVDEAGRLWLAGRLQHAIGAGRTILPIPLEQPFLRLQDVVRVALVGVGQLGQQRLVLVVETRLRGRRRHHELVGRVREKSHDLPIPIDEVLVTTSRLPVDPRHQAKLNRTEVARWASRKLGAQP